MSDFKDTFFPGRTWNPVIGTDRDSTRRQNAFGDDASSVTSASVGLSVIMQGKTQAEIYEARDKEERKQLMED